MSNKKTRKKYTPEQRAEFIAKVHAARTADPSLTLQMACVKEGITYNSFFNWTKAADKKTKGRRKKSKAVLVTAVVPVDAKQESLNFNFNKSNNRDSSLSPNQIAGMLAEMNAHSLRTLLQGVL